MSDSRPGEDFVTALAMLSKNVLRHSMERLGGGNICLVEGGATSPVYVQKHWCQQKQHFISVFLGRLEAS